MSLSAAIESLLPFVDLPPGERAAAAGFGVARAAVLAELGAAPAVAAEPPASYAIRLRDGGYWGAIVGASYSLQHAVLFRDEASAQRVISALQLAASVEQAARPEPEPPADAAE